MLTKASESPYKDIDVIPTPFPKLNAALGVGGIPHRKLTEITGKWGVGKTTLALMLAAQAQEQGKDVLWVDTEYSYDSKYAASLGVDNEKLTLGLNEFAEDALDEMEEWARKHKGALIVLDSIGGLSSRTEAEKASGSKIIGGQARLVAAFCRKMVPILAMNNNALIVLNHLFIDINHGNLMPSGGWKLSYHKSVELRLTKTNDVIRQGDMIIGRTVEAKIMKNKLAGTETQQVDLVMKHGEGFSPSADLLGDAIAAGVITKDKNKFFFQGERVAIGMPKMIEKMAEEAFADKVRAMMG